MMNTKMSQIWWRSRNTLETQVKNEADRSFGLPQPFLTKKPHAIGVLHYGHEILKYENIVVGMNFQQVFEPLNHDAAPKLYPSS